MVRPPCRAGAATIGNTILNIVAELLIKTGQRQTALAGRRAVILSPNDRPAPGNRSVAKGAIWPAPGAGPVRAIGQGEAVSAAEAEPVRAIVLAEAEPTVSEVVTFRAVAVGTGTPSVAVREVLADTTARALALAARAVARA